MALLVVAAAVLLIVAARPADPSAADPNRSGERYVSVQWRSDPGDRGRKIQVHYTYRGYVCEYRFHKATARETDTSVTIKVLAHRRSMDPDEACIAVLGGGTTTVKLERPLGSRRLRHAPVTDGR